jgi:hypothetical protein
MYFVVIENKAFVQDIFVKRDHLTYIQTCCIQHCGREVGLYHSHTSYQELWRKMGG